VCAHFLLSGLLALLSLKRDKVRDKQVKKSRARVARPKGSSGRRCEMYGSDRKLRRRSGTRKR
jgi:hypothetical protein